MESLFRASPLSKTFGQTRVLDGVGFEIGRGEIHGLVGRNGSGKSTFIKILSGYHAPDSEAWVEVNGERRGLPIRPADARHMGLSFMHQDLGLVPEFSVLDNVRIGRFATGAGWSIRRREEEERVGEALGRFEIAVSPKVQMGRLPEVDRALVALVRSFLDLEECGGGLLVLDEPTAFLPRDDVDRLFSAIRRLVSAGSGVLFVSHRLEEVLELTDRVSVLRDGQLVGTVTTNAIREEDLIELILGRRMSGYYPDLGSGGQEAPVLRVQDLSGPTLKKVALDLQPGEVVGVTGLRGMGHAELPHLLFGSLPATQGVLEIDGRSIDAKEMTPSAAMHLGMALFPADRQRTAAVPDFTVRDNVSLPVISRFFRTGVLRRRAEEHAVSEVLRLFRVQPSIPEMRFGDLSGGNQQKALLGKWFQRAPRLLLFHEPTAGVDVGSKREIFARIQEAAAQGSSVLVASEEWEDLAHICNRVVVFRDGEVTGRVLSGAELTEDRIVESCYALTH